MLGFLSNVHETIDVAVPAGMTLSESVDLAGARLVAVVMPSNWMAAALTFQVSHDGGQHWADMYDSDGKEITVAAAASRFIALNPALFSMAPMIKVRSGLGSASMPQTEGCMLHFIVRNGD